MKKERIELLKNRAKKEMERYIPAEQVDSYLDCKQLDPRVALKILKKIHQEQMQGKIKAIFSQTYALSAKELGKKLGCSAQTAAAWLRGMGAIRVGGGIYKLDQSDSTH